MLVPLAVLAVPLGLAHLESWVLTDDPPPAAPPAGVTGTGPATTPGSAANA